MREKEGESCLGKLVECGILFGRVEAGPLLCIQNDILKKAEEQHKKMMTIFKMNHVLWLFLSIHVSLQKSSNTVRNSTGTT